MQGILRTNREETDESGDKFSESRNSVKNYTLARKGKFSLKSIRSSSLTSVRSSELSCTDSTHSCALSNAFSSQRSFSIKTLRDGIADEAHSLSKFSDHTISGLIDDNSDFRSAVEIFLCDDVNANFAGQLDAWRSKINHVEQKRFMSKQRKGEYLDMILNHRIRVAHDLASALKCLHDNKIIFRDVRPENIGFDFEGNVKLFNFNNYEKQLSEKDKVGVDQYRNTRLEIPPRYQAPEVYYGKPYGYSADSYSFGLLLWQIISFRVPYSCHDDASPQWSIIYEDQLRPMINNDWPRHMKVLMNGCWDEKPSYRLGFSTICSIFDRYFASQEGILRNG